MAGPRHLYEDRGDGRLVVSRDLDTDGGQAEVRGRGEQEVLEAGLVQVCVSHLASTLPRLLHLSPARERGGRGRLAQTLGPGILLVNQNQLSGEGSLSHDGHLDHVSPTCAPDVHGELEFPDDNTKCEEEEKAGEEDRKENKEIDVKLVLAKEHVSNNVVGRILLLSRSVDQEVELGGAEIVSSVRDGDHEAVPDIFDQ